MKIAVDLQLELLPKKKLSSLAALDFESLPWHAFLGPASPYRALMLLGASTLALLGSVGPINFLHYVITSFPHNSIATIKSLHI